VPYVRGPETSRPPAAIVEQSKRLTQNGVKQITLLGQRVNAYEYNAGEKTYCLADLLEMLSQIDGIEWLKFVTSYPSKKYFEEIMRAMANLPKVCRYLHIPAQSGSDKILKAMNRGYTSAEYLDLIDTARQIVPDIAVAGDFIVGFPGETDEDFEQTVSLLKKAQYKNAFIFKYSPRPGTTAENRFEDNVPQEIKIKRNIELLKIQEQISEKLAQPFLGKTVKVLVEGQSKKSHQDSPQLIGRTATDWIVVFNGSETLAGQFTNVKISRTSPLTLFGEPDEKHISQGS
jgi:tRNA-2-methylthio-N6-dimethylallyladenosine synthase